MTLRRQLLLVSLLLLSLPWAGCQFIREMEGALRHGQTQSLQSTADAVAAVIAADESSLYPQPERRLAGNDERRDLYAFPAHGPVIVDGYGDGWTEVPAASFGRSGDDTSLAVDVRVQSRGTSVYLLFDVTDNKVVYHNPGLSQEPNGDRLILRLWANDRRQDYVIATAAPGSVRARFDGRRSRGLDPGRITGYWQDSMEGYSLELAVPLAYTGGRLGFFFIDEDSTSPRGNRSVGNTTRIDAKPPPWLIYRPAGLQSLLSAFSGGLTDIQVVDKQCWVLGELRGKQRSDEAQAQTFWLLRSLYRSILTSGDLTPPPAPTRAGKLAGTEIDAALGGSVSAQRYRDTDASSRTLLSAAAPVRDQRGVLGAVVVRQSGETYLSLTDQAFSRLLGYSLAALVIAAIGLFGYATVLSLRIRALSHAAANAIADDGRVSGTFTPSGARDEIGDLSRQYNELLARLKEYNDYLHTLSRKLAHELRTPIAVIQSSLDNLEHGDQSADALPQTAAARRDSEAARATYLARAREGLGRLQHILTAMSEATRLEESVNGQQKTRFDLVPLLRQLHAAYSELYQQHALSLSIQVPEATVLGVPELLVQALDKLLDNATSFAPPGGSIELRLEQDKTNWRLQVYNEGPALPPGSAEKIFEPMISERRGSDAVHLGLGLHIVKLIVDFHGGSVKAENARQTEEASLSGGAVTSSPDPTSHEGADPTGVSITMTLPAAQALSPETPAA
ncbi:MAG: proteobacterial dedicated sortase system histidine kinase [Halioglobus sp.]